MENSQFKISVIIPVYNSERFLQKCVNSVLLQTYNNFELLLVDDGSTDKSGTICDDFVHQDARVKVFHKSNGGVSSARNLGLDNANGDYVVFCDSDDWLDEDYLKDLYPRKGEDLVCCAFTSEEKGNFTMKASSDMKEILEESSTLYAFGSVCCKMFNASVLKENRVRFRNDISMGEDILFVLDFLCCHLKSMSSVSANGYFYNHENTDSLSHKTVPLEQSFKLVDLLYNRLQCISDLYGCDITYIKNEYLSSQLFNIISTIKRAEKSVFWKLRQFCRTINNKDIRNLLNDKKFCEGKGNSKTKRILFKTGLLVLRIYYKFF